MKKIFYRFNDDIYIDYQALYEWAKQLNINLLSDRDFRQMRLTLHPHRQNNRLLRAS